MFKCCQFSSIGARVDVAASDFGLAAKLGEKFPFCKVALILYQYDSNCPPIDSEEICAGNELIFSGHKRTSARKLVAAVVQEIASEIPELKLAERFAQKMFATYPFGSENSKVDKTLVEKNWSKLVNARTKLFSGLGRRLLAMGGKIKDGVSWAKAQGKQYGPGERAEVVKQFNMAEEFGKMEKIYRDQLLAIGVYTEKDIPSPEFYTPPSKPSVSAVATPQQRPASNVQVCVGDVLNNGAETGSSTTSGSQRRSTDDALFARLQIHGCFCMLGIRPNSPFVNSVQGPSLGPASAEAAAAAESGASAPEAPAEETQEPPRKRPRAHDLDLAALLREALEDANHQVYLLGLPAEGIAKIRAEGMVTMPGATEKTKQTFSVDVDQDDLLPPMAAPPTPQPVETPAQWRDAGDRTKELGQYRPAGNCRDKFLEGGAKFAAMALHMMVADCAQDVQVYMMSEERKTPLIMQVRSRRSFGKGSLTLHPFGEILAPPSGSKKGELVDMKLGAQNVHGGHLIRSWMKVTLSRAEGGDAQRRREAPEENTIETTFTIPSPLLKKQTTCLPPFWAVSKRSKGNDAAANMDLCVVNTHLPFPKIHGGNSNSNFQKSFKPSGGLPSMTAEVVVMSNTKPIEEGDVLSLPFYSAADR